MATDRHPKPWQVGAYREGLCAIKDADDNVVAELTSFTAALKIVLTANMVEQLRGYREYGGPIAEFLNMVLGDYEKETADGPNS